jgi:hypothetical protein
MASNRLGHPYVAYTMWEAPQLRKHPQNLLHYHDPGLHLPVPPEWGNLTENRTTQHVLAINMTVTVRPLGGLWRLGPLGPGAAWSSAGHLGR